jgi:hypothetical protein
LAVTAEQAFFNVSLRRDRSLVDHSNEGVPQDNEALDQSGTSAPCAVCAAFERAL